MPLINHEINLILTWSENCVVLSTNNSNQVATFAITDTDCHVSAVTLSTQERKVFFDQPVRNHPRTCDNIQKIATGKGGKNRTSCLLDYPCFKKYYQIIAIDLSKQQAIDADPKGMQQINLTANLYQQTTTFFSLSKKLMKLFWIFHREP